jgi:hypothetical protein
MRQPGCVKALILGAVVAVLAFLAVGVGPARADARGAGEPIGRPEVDTALRRVIDAEYQTELPHERAARLGKAGAAGDAAGRRLRGRELYPGSPGVRRPPRTYSVPMGGGLAGIAQLLLWMMVAVVVIMAVIWLVQGLRYRQADEALAPEPEPGDEGAAARAAMVARPLGDAEALAGQGRFAEAIHALLLRTIEELGRSLPTGLPRSFTSREIIGRVPMPERARSALSELVVAVELCYFGSTVPGAAEYHACRARFQEFAQAYVRGAAA